MTTVRGIKLVVLLVLAVGCSILVLWCVTKVGDLNGHAAALQACIGHVQQAGCPALPATAAQVANLHDEAGTIGDLGWVAFIFVGIDVIGTLVSLATD